MADGIKKLVKKADDAIDLEKHLPKKLLTEEAEAFAKKADKVADDVVEDAAKAIKSGSGSRKQAMNEAKDRAGVPRSQQAERQWIVGNDINRKGHDTANYRYDSNAGSHGRYYEYDTQYGRRVIVEHTNDGQNHFHAGQPKGNPNSHSYDFKENRYQKIDGPNGDHHIYY